MNGCRVENIILGEKDCSGCVIHAVYGRVSGRYAVYRNDRQIMVQFSDDDAEGINQRSALAPLGPLRSQISAMISKFSRQRSEYQEQKTEQYNNRLAMSLLIAIQGDISRAQLEMELIRDDILEDFASDTRTRHLMWASVAALVSLLLSIIFASDWFVNAFNGLDKIIWRMYWQAAGIGAIGALFSIALQIRAREVAVDTQPWDNRSDAILRIFVGATSAVVLIALFMGQFVEIDIAGSPLSDSTHGAVIIAFAGGFTERLVAEFLSRIGLASGVSSRRKAQPAVTSGPTVNEQTIASGAASLPMAGRTASTSASVPSLPPARSSEDEVEPDDDEAEASISDNPSRLSALSQPVG